MLRNRMGSKAKVVYNEDGRWQHTEMWHRLQNHQIRLFAIQ